MEVVYTYDELKDFEEGKINALYGDVIDLIHREYEINGIIYDEKWTVKRFLNGHSFFKNKRMESVFNYLELSLKILNHRLADLSKTDFKFVLLAYLLLNNMKIIIFDYFEVGLSYQDRKRLYRILKNMKKDGITIIYISKDIVYMNQFADNITIMKDQEICFQGAFKDIHEHRDLLSELPEIYAFIDYANSKGARLDYTLDSKELLKDIYRSVY